MVEKVLKEIGKEIKSESLIDINIAKALDAKDELKRFRQEFNIPKDNAGHEAVYLCGHSLGANPKRSAKYVNEELDSWAKFGVRGHFMGKREWVSINDPLIPHMAAVVGGKEDEVVCMNSLTANLHFFMVSFYSPNRNANRYKILIEDHAFPSDHYAVESQLRYHGFDPKDALILVKPRAGQELITNEDIFDIIEKQGDSIALILLSGVQYYTGQLFPIEEITRRGHAKGCVVGWDLAHAVGNVLLKLHDWNVDFACWCSYKYLNSGPGGIGGGFVHNKHKSTAVTRQRFAGWWTHSLKDRFKMDCNSLYENMDVNATGYQVSNPSVLTTVSLLGSLEIFSEAGIENLRKKSLLLTGYLEFLIKNRLNGIVTIITPSDPQQRGCQLSIRTPRLQEVLAELEEKGVICDHRHPDVIRLAPIPLYNTFTDVYRFVNILNDVLNQRSNNSSKL